MSSVATEPIQYETPRYTPNDNPKHVYRHISLNGKHYRIQKCLNGKREHYGTYKNIVDAVHERDQLESVNWDYDLLVELPTTQASFTINDLPPFESKRDKRPVKVPNSHKKGKYFGFQALLMKPYVNEDNPLTKVWHNKIMYNNHINHLGYYLDPLSPQIIYNIVKTELLKVKP